MGILTGEIEDKTLKDKIHYNRGDVVRAETINDIQDTAIDAHNMATEALDKADSVFQGNGTVVSVGGVQVGTLAFTSDPQQQLDTLNSKIGTASSFNAEIVDQLPTTNISTSTFYLIKNSTSADDNTYSEYLYVNGKWELLGNTQVQAYDDSELRTLINNLSTTKADKSAIPTKLPTPNKLTIRVTNNTPVFFDGSEAEEIKIDIPDIDPLANAINTQNDIIAELEQDIIANTNAISDKADADDVTANTNAISTINSKLNGIQSGAEVNVQSDWNVTDTSSDAYIKNKPTIPSISGLASETYVNTQVNTLQGKIDAKADKTTLDNYYNKTQTDTLLSSKATITSVTNAITEAKGYTDTKVAELIDSAPETLDTFKEIAEAFAEDQVVLDTLNSAIGNKVDKTTTINSKPLSSNITLTAGDVGALPNTTAIPKLYNDFGENTDGAVTQGAITPVLASFEGSINEFYGAFEELGGVLDAKYEKPSTGIPKTDLASAVQTSLGKADTALQSIPAEYITETELNAKGYASQSDLDTTNANVSANTTAINDRYTKDEILNMFKIYADADTALKNRVTATETAISDLEDYKADKIDTQSQYNTLNTKKADKTELESAVTTLNETIDDVRELIGESQGTVVRFGETPQPEVIFTSNPQDQIDALVEKTSDLVGKTYYVDGRAGGETFNDYDRNVASGVYSHAEGGQTDATGQYSHAEGFDSLASGQASHAEGSSTATGLYSHSEGRNTFAYGGYSHSEGLETIANHTASHASGYFTKTGRNHQTVMGTRNVGKTDTLLEVGNGYFDDITGNVINQNAFEVKEDGTLYTQNGTITDGTNTVSLNDVATKDEIPTNYVTNETYTGGLGAKADKTTVSQIANPNLIINGDFRINQRGNTTYSSSGYTVDRWQNSNNYGTLTKSSNYITFSASGGTAYLVQRIEDSGNLVGKTVTLSVCLSDDTIYSATETLQAVANSYATIFFEWGNVRIYYYSATGYFAPTIHITDGNSVSVKWVKLELGSVATPYSIKPYAEELTMCERYFLKLDFISGQNIFVGFNGGSSASRILIPCHLRTSPTLKYSNVSHFGVNTTGNPITATGLSLSGYTNVGVNITVNTTGLTAGQGSNLYIRQAGAYLSFDAEIY